MKTFTLILVFSLFSTAVSAQVTVGTIEAIDSVFWDDGIVFDEAGNMYGVHFGGDRIYKRTPDGTFSVYADGFNAPNGIDFDSEGNLFVADHFNHAVYKILPDGTVTDHVTGINRPSGMLKMQGSDTMIVTRYVANIILKIAPDGHVDTLAMGFPLNGPVGLTYDNDGRLYTGNFNNRKVIAIDPDGSMHEIAQFPGPGWLGFLAYANGHFYGTAYNAHKIYQVRQSDTLVSLLAGAGIGEVDGDTSVALFDQPNGIIPNATGDTLFITASGTGNIRYLTGLEHSTGLAQFSSHIAAFNLYPNPATTQVNIRFTLDQNQLCTLRLIQANGKTVYQMKHSGIEGENSIHYNLESLPSGSYFAELTVDRHHYYKQFFVNQ